MKYDATGVDASEGFPLIDKPGWYPFRVSMTTETTSKNGDYQVIVDAVCLDHRWMDYNVRHWVTFLPAGSKGAGMAIHWLKCIGEPYEGLLDVNPLSWERKLFMGKVSVNKYKTNDGTEKVNNKFEAISPFKGDEPTEFGAPREEQKTAFDE